MTNWQTKKLGDIGTFFKGSGIPKDSAKSGDLPAVRYGELYTSFDIFINQVRSSIDQSTAMSAAKILKGDILFAGSGETVEEIGRSAVYQLDQEGYAGGDIVIMRPGSDQDSRFLGQALNSDEARKQLRKFGQGQSVVHVYRKDLEKLELLLPEKPEQERIVGVLEVWDEYIEKLEQKIALKEQLKKGLMQQLLTGKRRLPGFSGEWKATTIGDVSTISMGQSPSSSSYNNSGNGLVLIQGNADMKNGLTVERVWTTEVTKEAPKGSLIMTVRAPVGEIAVATQKVCLGRGVCAIKSDYSNYLRIYLDWFKPKWLQFIQGSTFESVNGTDVRKLKIRLPETEEASSIVSVINVVEDEIEVMKSICNNTKLQKKYLLKNLITGTIRTPEDLQPLDASRLERSAL